MSPADPAVSVVIPLYNREKYIARAIDSVLAQTYNDFELIVIDDGSTDNGSEVVKQYDDQRIKIVSQQNAGVSSARNAGIDLAKGKWIAFLDSDDQWLPEKLQCQVDFLNETPTLRWVGSNCTTELYSSKQQKFFVDPKKIDALLCGSTYFEKCFDAINIGAGLTPGMMLIERSVFDEYGKFQDGFNYGEEIELWWRIGYNMPAMGYINKPLLIYHSQTPDSLTACADTVKTMNTLSEMFEKHLKLSKKYDMRQYVKPYIIQRLRKWSYNLYCRKHFKETREILKRFGDILPADFKLVMNLLTLLPEKSNKHGLRLLNWLSYDKFEF